MDRALVLFWRKGYQATSLADLLAAMGIGRSSFYAAFTDKRSLFIHCLDLFAQRTTGLIDGASANRPPLDALQDFFERSFVGTPSPRDHWGCMMVNSVTELAGVDDDLAGRASQYLAALQKRFQMMLEDAGAAPAQAEELAALLMLINEGIRVSSRRRLPGEQLRQPITATFRLIRSAVA
ncbi:TetR/AcrR family transcriptional regulator [Sandarakinorhabdus sp.]|uniref:TetR/AcrR family transcriptional regulator n=1 Tax=Sandarakinorhabdus sp. TaxID=1916663 RepID=UPI00286E85FC|nr:TetR/AcrR family transcriptional regulator [Sandarakinorhabdus sp.]